MKNPIGALKKTRMHSSRMRTVRSLPYGGVVSVWGWGLCQGDGDRCPGVSVQGGVSVRGESP